MPPQVQPTKKFFVPEVIQTSEMDCGPASLKSLLEGFGIHTSYGRLREACQTSVDGTSIDSIEDLAVRLGLSSIEAPPEYFAPGAQKADLVAFPELGAEAVLRLEVEDFPAIVVNDIYGGDAYDEGKEKYRVQDHQR